MKTAGYPAGIKPHKNLGTPTDLNSLTGRCGRTVNDMRRLVLPVWLLLGLLCAIPVRAEDEVADARWIPFDSLTATNRVLAHDVMDHVTLRCAYTAEVFKARVPVFEYLFDHMESCSALAQKEGLITYRATRDADGKLHADDHDGAAGYMLTLYASDGKRVIYVAGTQHGLFDASGRGVAIVDYHVKTGDEVEYTRAAFVRVDNVVLATMAQMFAIFLHGTVDKHFAKVIRNPVVLSEKAQSDPQKLLEQISQMPAADQQLMAPFAELVRSNAAVRVVEGK